MYVHELGVITLNADVRQTLKFIKEIDQYKQVFRRVYLDHGKRLENDAEHSWHVAMMVWLFASQYEQPINLERALKMTLIHDLPEIDTGDMWSFDAEGRIGKHEREAAAMARLLAPLPEAIAQDLAEIWQEYDRGQTAEARFVQAMDKLHPVIENVILEGRTWEDFHVTEEMARARKTPLLEGSAFLLGLFDMILGQVREVTSARR